MHITLWTAEMFTAEETQIYIIPLDPPSAHWWIMSSKLLTTLYWDNTHKHTKVIWMTFFASHFMYENISKMHSKITSPIPEKDIAIWHSWYCLHRYIIPTLMVRRTPMGWLLKGGANKVSLSVIGWPVYIVLLRKTKNGSFSSMGSLLYTQVSP